MQLTTVEFQKVMAFAERTPERGSRQPNLYLNEDDFEVIREITERAWSRDRYPGHFQSLEEIRQHHQSIAADDVSVASPKDEPKTTFNFFEAGVRAASEEFTVTAYGAVVRGYKSLNLTVTVIDEEKGELLSKGKADLVNVYDELKATFKLSGTSGRYTVILIARFDPSDGSPSELHTAKLTGGTQIIQADDPSISHPVRRSNNPADPGGIVIGLGRNWGDQGPGSRMDYAWAQPSSNNPKGQIPFVGEVLFPKAIADLKPNLNFALQISVANVIGGGTVEILPENMGTVFNGFSIDPQNPRKLQWRFDPGRTTTDPGNPIVFEHIKWPSDMQAIFFMQALVFSRSNEPMIASVRSYKGAPPIDPPDGHLSIMPIVFWWHCLAKDTLVTMGDGEKKPIQEIVEGDMVTSDLDVGPAEVLGTQAGYHFGDVYRFKTSGGRNLTCTEDHVLVSEAGMKMAKEIRRGDKLYVLTRDCNEPLDLDTVTKVWSMRGYDEAMYNLVLRAPESPQKIAGYYFANDFLTGDTSASRSLEHSRRTDIVYLRSKLHSNFHTDIVSYLEDSRTTR